MISINKRKFAHLKESTDAFHSSLRFFSNLALSNNCPFYLGQLAFLLFI